nr:DNA-processing protein DprA [Halocynthiibacter namhaensis]
MDHDLFTGNTAELAPPDPKERFARLQLIRSPKVGLTTFYRLLDRHGSARVAIDVMAQDRPDWSPIAREQVHQELKAGKAAKASLILWGDPFYPAPLKDIPDPPAALWAKGNIDLLQRPAVAIVGARNASSIGLRMAKRLAGELGKNGIIVVSGLARGTDSAAHNGALAFGTIAVVAGGVDVIYPSENKALHNGIAKNGLILSEHPAGTKPTARHFPMRNRIISGLSQGVLVVEAALKSGSMITAKNALDQGRDVLAVPGHPIDMRASGCNALIRDGATLIRNVDDILTALPQLQDQPTPAAELIDTVSDLDHSSPRKRPPRKRPAEVAELHNQILNTLTTAPLAETQLMEDLNVTLPDLDLLLTRLEIDGRIERKTGGVLRLLRQE